MSTVRQARIETLTDSTGSIDIYPRTMVDGLVNSNGKKVNIICADENGKVPSEMLPDNMSATTHANTHGTSGTDPITPSMIGAEEAGAASQALTDANKYTDEKIAAIPTPDVSGQIGTHNTDPNSHADIRELINNHDHPIADSINGVNYELSSENGKLVHDIVGEYTEFEITQDNRDQIGYTDTTTDLVIPAAFIGEDGVTYKVTSIGNSAFLVCKSLTSVTIPNSVTSIGDDAFSSSGLTSVTIPNSVTSIGDDAFSHTALTSIVIPGSVTSIGTNAFYGCTNLASITIPDSVTSIGNYAFNGCNNLNSIIIPDSVTSIGIYAFNGCNNLSSINIHYGLISIGQCAFDKCTSLSNIIIPDSVTSIGTNAFRDCTALTNVTISNSITSISDYLFRDCTSLTSIVIPGSVTSIGTNAFYGCTNLASITIPDSVTSIGNYAFNGCNNLNSIIIPDSVTSIGECVFYGCTSMTSITIPDGVTTIGSMAFADSSNLNSIIIPNTVNVIDMGAFYGCSTLATIYYTGTEEEWDNINIQSMNNPLNNATIVYGYTGSIKSMTGATADTDGTSGLVPVPVAGDQDKFLRGDGTWSKAGGTTFISGTIGTNWTEDENTGVKTQLVQLSGVTSAMNGSLDVAMTHERTTEGYAAFVEEQNQFLDYITNGDAETVDGGIMFYIYGDPNTINIPFIVEVG